MPNESEEYRKRLDEHRKRQTIIRKPEPEYDPKKMEIGMPLGCWVWVGIAAFAVCALFTRLFF
jgi:hypothetical protein